ncbi:Hsp70 chaperone [Entomophthora muscae]|uniref:Hsp70 chaperone n=1 Tax=Entomophthora muscae TaxID=34485 RepID=A0ACC2RG73_9FUNG|nr:Hsp70 chaperone [Entomophthora muscae]
MIGRQINDAQLQTDLKHWPFKVKQDNGKPVVEVTFKGGVHHFTPEQISAMILLKMKQTAELKLGAVKDVIITVPAYFNNAQRQATKDAGESAGFNVLRILAEPTAAALAYGLDANSPVIKNVLVYDLGGGTFDVSVLTIEGSDFKVLATSGDTHLEGEDFDTLLVEHFVRELQAKKGQDISKSPRALRRLRTACERAKRILSSATRATVEVEALYDGIDFQAVLTRAKFDEICGHLFGFTITFIKKILDDAGLQKSQIDEIVLSGGSSRIPKVQQLLSEFFGGKKLNTSINLDEAVAMGAAIQAQMLKGSTVQRIKDIYLVDIAPLSLGIESGVERKMTFVVARNTPLPTTKSQNFTTVYDWQTTVRFAIFEGESLYVDSNALLGEFRLENIQSALKGVPKFLVKFTIDLNVILHVSAVDKLTGSYKDIAITNYRNRSSNEIQALGMKKY